MVFLPSFPAPMVPFSLIIVGLLILKLIHAYLRWIWSPLQAIPGPKTSNFFLGVTTSIFFTSFMSSQKKWWKHLREKHKEVPMLAYSTVFGQWTVHILDCDIVQTILTDSSVSTPPRFPKQYKIIRLMTGNGLVALEGGREWSRHRRIVQPAFFTKTLRKSFVTDTTTTAPYLATLLQAWRTAARYKVAIDVLPHLAALTLDIFGKVATGKVFGGTRRIQEWAETLVSSSSSSSSNGGADTDDSATPVAADHHPIAQSVHETFTITPMSIPFGLLGIPGVYEKLSRRFQHTNKVLDEAVEQVIRNSSTTHARDNDNGTCCLMQLLVKASQEEEKAERMGLSSTELRAETRTFIVVGHETTSVWCYWALYALAKHANVQDKLYQDIARHCSSSNDPDAAVISLEQVDEMEYLAAFLKEVLRFYPPIGFVLRHTSQAEHWKGYTVPAHTRLVIPIHLLHRHPDHWTDPDRFWPERWLQKPDAQQHKFCFLPFLAGGRNCVGQRMAEIEVKIIIASIIREFQVSLTPNLRGKELKLIHFMTMKSDPLVEIMVKDRNKV